MKSNLVKIRKKLNLKDERINIYNLNLKSLKISKKIKLDQDDRNLILKSALYYFDNFNYSKKIPTKYL